MGKKARVVMVCSELDTVEVSSYAEIEEHKRRLGEKHGIDPDTIGYEHESESDIAAFCEGCDEPVLSDDIKYDSEGVPLCPACFAHMLADPKCRVEDDEEDE